MNARTQTTLNQLKAGAANEDNPEKQKNREVQLALYKAQTAMRSVLPKHMTPERMSRMALGILRTNYSLANAARNNPASFAHAVVQAGQLGLEIGAFGEAHLVPFKNEITLIPGYQGLVKLAKNSGLVVDIYAHEVREKDKFGLTFGMDRTLVHEPLTENGFPASDEARGPITGFYAVAVYKDGTKTFVALSVSQVLKTRNDSRGYQSAKKNNKESPWDTHFEAMGRKTAVRALCNWLPKRPELNAALQVDYAHDNGETAAIDGDFIVTTDEPTDGGDAGGESVDKDTGEIKPDAKKEDPTPTTGASSTPAANEDVPTLEDAVALIKKREYDMARDDREPEAPGRAAARAAAGAAGPESSATVAVNGSAARQASGSGPYGCHELRQALHGRHGRRGPDARHVAALPPTEKGHQ
jgi:recombination protein RecT